MPQSSFPMLRAIGLTVWLGGLGVVIMIATGPTNGTFIYALDDPYIHLAIAEQILAGGYGVNAGEYAAASSSMIYPYLLAGLMTIGIDTMGPLVINLAATATAIWLGCRFIAEDVMEGLPITAQLFFGICLALPFMMGAYHLPLAGMEHTLHILTVVMAITGLVRTHKTGRVHPLLPLAIILMPLLRFEGIAYAGALIAALILWRHYVSALLCVVALGAACYIYSSNMQAMGLPLLPGSVLTKSTLASGSDNPLISIAYNLRDSFKDRQGVFLYMAIAGLIAALPFTAGQLVRRPIKHLRDSAALMIIVTTGIALTAHIVAGAYGWFGRYEVYAFVLGWFSLLYLYRDAVRTLATEGQTFAHIGLILAMLVSAGTYVNMVRLSLKAGPTIYDQQVQMHRFITEYHPVNVAVNDLGRIAYQNDNYVLDLWALGSEEVRKARANGTFDRAFVDQLAKKHDVQFAMIYEQYFTDVIPSHWQKVATLTRSTMISEVGQTVSFYTTTPAPDIKGKLTRFGASLPDRVAFDILID